MKTRDEILAEARQAGVKLWLEGGELRFRAPKGALLPGLRAALLARKEEIVALLAGAAEGEIPRRPQQADYALSPAQRRLWVLAQLDPASSAYHIPLALLLVGVLDRAALAAAVSGVVRRHESLRTVFAAGDGEPRQRVLASAETAIEEHDLSSSAEAEETARGWLRRAAARPFDLEAGPLLRVALLRLAPERWVLSAVLHHIVADGVSLAVLVREIAQSYDAARRGVPWAPPPLRIHYRDFSGWQNARLAGPAMEAHRDYWLGKLAGVPPALELPADFPRPPEQTFRGRVHAFRLDSARLQGLHALARRERASLFMVLVAMVKVLLRRHTGQEDIVVACPIAGREHADLEGQIGFYLNTLVLRDRVDTSASFLDLLRAVRATALEAYDHQAYPFDRLVDELGLPRDLSRAPLCDVVVMLQNTGDLHLALAGVAVRAFPTDAGISKFDLTFDFQEGPDGLDVGLEYNTDLFDPGRIGRLATHLSVVCGQVLSDPQRPMARWDILGSEERRQVLQEFNATARAWPRFAAVTARIEAQAVRTPDEAAVRAGGQTLSYAELNARANRLARRLRALGAGPGKRVAVCLERSPELVVTLLAVLKAGAAYVPLDPGFPAERLGFILRDSEAAILVTDGSAALAVPEACVELRPSLEATAIAAEPAANLPEANRPEQAAYVIYTSGSTGTPKGVEVLHGGLANLLLSFRERPGLAAADAVLAVTTVSFDIAGLELWLPLIVGARIELVSRADAVDGAALQDRLRDSGATVLQATPATWRLLLAANWAGTPGLRLWCGGEALPTDLARQLLPLGAELWNLYGPTETTIWSTLHRVLPGDIGAGNLPIGRPIANTQCYVLDRDGQPAPIGVPGEMAIGGDGVAGGYWRRPGLTAEKFIPDPFSSGAMARLYRTGDLVRWRTDGTLDYLGRGDDQVKLRGHRIELGEIEAALCAHPSVGSAVVALREDVPGDGRLAAYVVPAQGGDAVDPASLRSFLRERLPDYMVPTAWRTLAELPLTPNRKVDRRALPAPEAGEAGVSAGWAAPRTATEREVALVWQAVLGQPRVGLDDNFFEIGGHSLKAAMAAARLRGKFAVKISVADIFRHPTLAGLARQLDALGGISGRRPGQPEANPLANPGGARPDSEPLSAAQRRLWIIAQMRPDLAAYHMPEALCLEGRLDRTALSLALRTLVERHEALRTVIIRLDGEPRSQVGSAGDFSLNELDLGRAPDPEAEAREIAAQEAARPFDLGRGPLFRATLVRLAPERHLLLCTLHHIVGDAWSVGVLMRELSGLYGAFASGRLNPLPPLPAQYGDFARAQNMELAGPAGAGHRAYWVGRLGGERAPLDLPLDFPRPALQTDAGATHAFSLGAPLSAALVRVGRTQGATPFMTLLALVKVLLARITGQQDIVVASPVAGRDRVEWEGVVGFFVNTLALRDTVDRAASFSEILARVRATCLGAFEHQLYPFDRLVEDLQVERDLSRSPIFDVSLQLAERGEAGIGLPGLTVAAYDRDRTPSKCDLSFDFADTPEGFACALTYNSDLFLPERIARLADMFLAMAGAALADAGRPVGGLPLFGADERRRLVETFNPAAGSGGEQRSVVEAFADWVKCQPGHPAVLGDAGTWTYGELDRKADRLARALLRRGIGREERVGVLLGRGPEQALAFLALLKAGAVYLPLDPLHPAERIRLMMADAGARVVLVQGQLRAALPAGAAAWTIEDLLGEPPGAEDCAALPSPCPGQGAYLIYTSGSTGTPKGVLVEHRGVVNTLRDQAARLAITPADRILQFANCSFDAAVFETLLALLHGATLVPTPPQALSDPREFVSLLRTRGVTVAVLPPSFVRSLDRADLPLRILFTAGEAAWAPDVAHYRERLTYVNGYGPTEASICSAAYVVPAAEPLANGVPIGTPVAGTQSYVLDADLQLAPIGVAGEICVGGAGVARGYWGRPDLTAERFVPDPYSAQPGARLYRTGDRGRWRPDGVLEFLGRTDSQVKLRGFRIELGEIEAALASHPCVRQCAVVLRRDRPGISELAAYFTAARLPAPPVEELRAHLALRLPEHMIPQAWVELEAFSLTTAGKVDRRALPAPAAGDAGAGTAPRNAAEEQVAGVLRGVLQLAGLDVHANFFHLGGNSLLAMQAIARLRDLGRPELSIREFFALPTVAGLAGLPLGSPTSAASIGARPADRLPELSFAQQRLWFVQQLDPASPAYNISVAVRLDGELDAARLEAALNALLQRQESLRTCFPTRDGRAALELVPELALRLAVTDLGACPPAELEGEVRRRIDLISAQPFDLAAAPLMRLALLRVARTEHVAVLVMHHLVSDGWSMEILIRELSELYAGRSLAPLAVSAADFAAWQRNRLQGPVLEAQLSYWRRQLADPPTLALPTDRARPGHPTLAGATETFVLSGAVAAGARRLAKAEDATLFMVLLAAFQALLHRYSGQDDIVVGSPVANRGRVELEPVIGFFVNTLVLRADFAAAPSFRALVQQMKQRTLEALAHQEAPFEKLVQELQPDRDLSRNPLFQVMFSVQPKARTALSLAGLELTPLRTDSTSAKFDLTLALEETGDGLGGAWEYGTELFDAATIRRFATHFGRLLEAGLKDPDQAVAALELCDASELAQVVTGWNQTGRPYPPRSLGELFAEQAAARPEAVAVKFGRDQLTYGELDQSANRLARHLIRRGVGPDVTVPVCLERSLDLVVALVGIAKAGGAYAALDPHYPPARLAGILAELAAPVLVTALPWQERLPAEPARVLLDRDAASILREGGDALAASAGPESLAYVSYTSGSTGRPKGVAVTQRGVVRLVRNADYADLGPQETFLQLAPLGFDASTLEIWAPLLNGGRLVVAPPGNLGLEDIARLLREDGVTTLWLTAGLFHLMVDEQIGALGGLRQLIAGGDVLSSSHVLRVRREFPGLRLINGYGPTENTTFTCCHTVQESDLAGGPVPIGRPIANTRVYIVDRRLRPVPIGIPGELLAGGDGLARCYLGDPALTAEKFLPDPFHPHSPGRLYRTGDRARWRTDGTIEFLGRLDQQVKIRGYRIEPAEVEAELRAEPGVRLAAVVVHEAAGRKRLVGYATGAVNGETLRRSLQARLPEYLVPAVIVVRDALPLTDNGKVDRAALPPPDLAAEPGGRFVGPRDDRERAIAAVWRAVLGLERAGVHDNYFTSGGDSIGAIQVASRLQRAGWRMAVRDLFQCPTIAELAPRLVPVGAARPGAVAAPDPGGPLGLTPAQAWFFARHPQHRSHFNQAVLLRPRQRLDRAGLQAIVGMLWERHDALRTVFPEMPGANAGGMPSASLAAPRATPSNPSGEDLLEFVDLSASDAAESLRLEHSEGVQRSFNPATGPLFKAVLYRLPAGDRLLLAAHHLVIDGVSWRILLEEIELGLRQQARGEPVDLGPATDSIRRWTQAAAAWDGGEAGWWQAQAAIAAPAWPVAAAVSDNCFGSARTAEIVLAEELTRRLLTTAHLAYHTEVNDLLLTALARALRLRQNGTAVRITLEGHGREDLGAGLTLDRTVGWFTSLFPMVLPVAGGDRGEDIRRIKEALRGVPRKGAGYGISAFLGSPGQRPTAPWPTVSFNYMGQLEAEKGGELDFADESPGTLIGAGLARQHELDFGAAVVGGRMALSLTYHPGRMAPAAAQTLLFDFQRELEGLALATAGTAPEKTPADFTSQVLDLAAYDALLRQRGWGAAAVEDVSRLSPMQAGLLFESVFAADSTAYFVQMAYLIRGALRPGRFAEAWCELVRRHQILRTSFVHEGQTTPVQLVWRDRAPEVSSVDLRGQPAPNRTRAIADYRRGDLKRPFDLERGPLVRVGIFQLADDAFQVVWSYPHLLLDGWSLGVLHRDLRQLYRALADGEGTPPAAAVPYGGYLRWLEGQAPGPSRAFWRERLAGYVSTASLPRLVPAAESTGSGYAEAVVDLGPAVSAALRASAAGVGVTLATLVQAAWGVILGRYNRSEDVVFGGIVSGRPPGLAGVEEMVGLFICALPVRVRPRAGCTFAALAREVQAAAIEAEAHQYLPTAEIQAMTPLGGALFDHVVIVENYPVERELARSAAGGDGWAVEDVEAHDRTHYDFDLTVIPGDTLLLKLAHDPRVFPEAQIALVGGHLRTLLTRVATDPGQSVDEYSLLNAEEERRVLIDCNATDRALPAAATLVDLLEEQAARTPETLALCHGDAALTYRELHERAAALARRLRELGAGPETAVGICVERSEAMVIAVLGIWKAGAAYVPLDPLYPAERLAFMLQDSGASILVTQSNLGACLAGGGHTRVLIDAALPAAPRVKSEAGLRPHHLAYIIYTSGSTGRPKGVMVEHRSLVNAAAAWREAYGADVLQGPILQLASLSFDVFAGDLIRALTNGGTLVIADGDVRLDPPALCALLARHRIGLFESTPGLILPLMDQAREQGADLGALRVLIIGSDTLPAAAYARLVTDFGRGRRILNSYGVTEATIDSSFHEDPAGGAGPGASTPIGRPLANTRLYVLDERRRAVPIGVAGELYIGGEGLSRGYWRQPELTAERFEEIPVGGRSQRLYRTGDLARRLLDGSVEFLGRGDGQVKVRGFRVELGEVESRLRQHPHVRDVAVALAVPATSRPGPGGGGNMELAAYVVSGGAWDPAALRAHVLAELPEYMAPAYWVQLERLPLSPNGKVDRRALPAPEAGAVVHGAGFVAPQGPLEEALARIWREVLQVERIGVSDNFFALGGHSLKAMQIVSRAQQEFGVKPGLRAFFAEPTILGLAAQLGSAPRESLAVVPPAPAAPDYELSYAQQRLWLLHGLGGASAYNMPEAYVLDTAVDAEALERAFCMLVARHEALRTAFILVDGEPRQRILPSVPFQLSRVDLTSDPQAEESARVLADREAAEPFDLSAPPLLRATLVTLAPGRCIFLFTMHHIVGDGWSGNVLYREVFALYAASRRRLPDPLAPLRIHYKDFAVWQKARSFAGEERHWLARMAGAAALALPYDLTPGAARDFRGDTAVGEIDAATTDKLRALARARHTTMANVVLAVFEVVLFQLTQQEDICIGVSVANRSHPDLENLIGFFVNILPVRVRLGAAMEFDELLGAVVAAAEEAFEHQDYPFDLLIQKLNPARVSNRQPLLNVIFAYQNFADVHVAAGAQPGAAETELSPTRAFAHAFRSSKFDLTLFVEESEGRLLLTLEFDTGLFRPETARRYLGLIQRFAALAGT